jgi:hypothetical protein
MPKFDRALYGGTSISNWVLAPRSRRGNTNQTNDYWRAITTSFATAYESIAVVNVGAGGQSSIEFNSISSAYKHLQIRGSFLASTGTQMNIRVNGDATANYSTHRQFGTAGGGVFAGAAANANNGIFFSNNGAIGNPSLIIEILDYANTSTRKTIRGIYGQDTSSPEIGAFSAAYFGTSAITSVSIIPNSGTINQHSKFALYGIRG